MNTYRLNTSLEVLFLLLYISFAPRAIVVAQVGGNFAGVVELILRFIELTIPIAWVVLLFSFIYGIAKFLLNFDDERAREEGKKAMVFTIVATAIVFMVWGIITLLNNSVFGDSAWGIPTLTPPTNPTPP
jgi:hypothetical protein